MMRIYEIKRKMSREQASIIIRKQYRIIKKDMQEIKTIHEMIANLYCNRGVDNLIHSCLEQIPNETQKTSMKTKKTT
jgi:hypothetical protein